VVPDRGDQPVGDRAQQLVAARVAVDVVDELETVDIAEQDRGAPAAVGEALGQPLQDEGAVGQAGERVVHRLVEQFDLVVLVCGDVLHLREDLGGLRVGPQQGRAQAAPDHAAVGAHVPLLHRCCRLTRPQGSA
jgi:hypothetical protein